MNKDRIILLSVIVILLLLAGFMFYFVFPWAGERFAVWGSGKLSETLGTEASFRSLSVTRSGKIVIRDLLIIDPLGKEETFFYSPRVEIRIDPLNVVKDGVNLSRVYLLRPMVSIYRRDDGKWNIHGFRKREKSEGSGKDGEGKPFRLRIHEVVLDRCVTKLRGVLGEEIVTVLDHRGALDITAKKQEISLFETHFSTTYLTMTDMSASGVLTVEDKVLTFDNFRVVRDSTSVALEGDIDFKGRDKVDIQIEKSRFDLDHIPPRYGLRHKVTGNVELEMMLKGFIDAPEISGRVYRAAGETFGYGYANLGCRFHIGEGVIKVEDLTADFLDGTIGGEVSFFLRESPRAFSIDLLVTEIDITTLPFGIPREYSTELNGEIVAYGAGFNKENHSSTILLDLEGSSFKGTPLERVQAQILAKGNGFHVVSSDIQIGGGRIELSGELGREGPDLKVSTESIPVPMLMHLLDLPYALSGNLYCSVVLTDDYSRPSVQGQIILKDGEIYGWSFAGLESDLEIRQADGEVGGEIGVKAFMVEKSGFKVEEAQAEASFDHEGIRFSSLRIKKTDDTILVGRGDLRRVDGRFSFSTPDLRLVHNELEVILSKLESEIDWKRKYVEIEDLRLKAAEGEAAIKGRFSWPDAIGLEIDLYSVHLEALDKVFSSGEAIEGKLNLRLVITGSPGNPEIVLRADIRDPAFHEVGADSLSLEADYSGSRLRIVRALLKGGGHDCFIVGDIPLRVSLSPLEIEGIDPGSIRFRADLGRIDFQSLKLLTDEVEFIGGYIEGEIAIDGTLGSPKWRGEVAVRAGEGIVNRTNTYFDGLEASISFHDDQLEVPDLSADLMGGGEFQASGKVGLKGFLPNWIDFDIVTKDYLVNQIQYVTSLSFDAEVDVAGEISYPEVTGKAFIHRGALDIPIGQTANGGEDERVPFQIQIELLAENDLWIHNSQVNVEISLDMGLVTREGRILPVGDLGIIRGTYTYFGTIFDIEEGDIHFFGSHPINPALNVLTTRKVTGRVVENGNSVRVTNDFHLNVYGRYHDVKFDIVVYDSNGDILAVDRQKALTLLLANMTSEEFDQQAALDQQKFIGQIEGILTQQTSSLIQPISRFDILELRTNLLAGDNETSRAQVTVGEYLMKDFFVSYSQDILDPSINNIVVEIFLGKSSSVIGQTDSKGRQYSVELRYRVNY